MSAVCWLRRQCLWNVKISWLFICCLDLILWIPLHPLILLQALCILHHKVERNIWVLVWTSVMNPSNILFPSKVIFNFIAVCLCILPNNCLDRIPTGKNDSEGSVSLEETIDLGDVPSRRWLSRASLLCHAGGLSAEGGWMGFLSWVRGLLFFFKFIYYQQILCHQWVSLSLPAHTMFTPLRQPSQWLPSHPPVRVTSQTGSGTQAQSKTISSRICFKVGNFHIKMWVYGIADGFPPERGKRCVKTFSWQIRRTWQAGASSPQGRRLCFPTWKDADAGPGCFVAWFAATALAQALALSLRSKYF